MCVCVCVAVSRQQEESLWIGGWWPAMNYTHHSGVGAALPPSCRVLTDRAQQATTSGPHRCLTYQSRPLLYYPQYSLITHRFPAQGSNLRWQIFVGGARSTPQKKYQLSSLLPKPSQAQQR